MRAWFPQARIPFMIVDCAVYLDGLRTGRSDPRPGHHEHDHRRGPSCRAAREGLACPSVAGERFAAGAEPAEPRRERRRTDARRISCGGRCAA